MVEGAQSLKNHNRWSLKLSRVGTWKYAFGLKALYLLFYWDEEKFDLFLCLNVLLVNSVDFMVVYHGFFLVLENLFLDLSLKRGMSFWILLTPCCYLSMVAYADLPENVKCMMDCEALDILQGIQDQLPILSKDPEFRLPVWGTSFMIFFIE